MITSLPLFSVPPTQPPRGARRAMLPSAFEQVTENEISKQIVDSAYRTPTALGPGLLESVYEAVLAHELQNRGLQAIRQQEVPVDYHGTRIETGFRADLIIEGNVIVEIKSIETILVVHKKQLLPYLRLPDNRLRLLITFNLALTQAVI